MTKKRKYTSNQIALLTIATIATLTMSTIINGLTFAQLWEWFVSEKFGLPTLSAAEGIGLIATISFATYQFRSERESNLKGVSYVERLAEAFFNVLLRCGFALLIGAIVHSFV
jgi:hypothetical protein